MCQTTPIPAQHSRDKPHSPWPCCSYQSECLKKETSPLTLNPQGHFKSQYAAKILIGILLPIQRGRWCFPPVTQSAQRRVSSRACVTLYRAWFANTLAALPEPWAYRNAYALRVSSYHLTRPHPGLATSDSTDQHSNSHSGSKAINSQNLWQSFACAFGMASDFETTSGSSPRGLHSGPHLVWSHILSPVPLPQCW